MQNSETILQARLNSLDGQSLRRSLNLRRGLDLSSNDYLGFCEDPEFKTRALSGLESIPMGSAGSRLLRGHLELHERVETELAQFSEKETATLFPSGFQANLGLLSAILTPNDAVFSDELNHASIIDGIRLSRAQKEVYAHRDLDDLREKLKRAQAPNANLNQTQGPRLKVIVTESLFSMDGDFAPLKELVLIAREFDALLIVDEAHATGLYGNFEKNLGAGLVQKLGLTNSVFATVHTGGKSLGSGGAWVAGSSVLKEILVNFSRPFIFSTAPIPALAHFLSTGLDHWKQVGVSRALEIETRSKLLHESLLALGLPCNERPSPIQAILLGSNERSLEVAGQLQLAGFDVRAIRPPTVKEGTARLRVTVNWNFSRNEIKHFVLKLQEVL